MHQDRASVFVKVIVFATLWFAICDGSSIVRKFSIVEDSGHASNCGKVPFSLSWTPKVLSARHPEDVSIKYSFPYPLDGGFYNLTLTEYGQSEPFLSYANPFTCDDLKGLHVPCPLPAGLPIITTQHVDNVKYLMSFPGHYTLRAEVKNKEGHQMICALLDLIINNN